MQDVYDRNITIYDLPGSEMWKHEMSKLPFPFPELARSLYIASSFNEFDNITKYHVLEKESLSIEFTSQNIILIFQGTHAQYIGSLIPLELKWAKDAGTAWYRSKEPVPINHPFVGDGYLSNKKWPLIEEYR